MQIYIKNRTRRKEEFQFFMHQFVEECMKQGFIPKTDILPTYRFYVRSILRRLLSFAFRCTKKLIKPKQALLITANGGTITDEFFPYYFNYELVPFLWDCWPYSWKRMCDSLKMYDVKLMFVTSRQVADKVRQDLHINAYWIPEGIDDREYRNDLKLVDRSYDVFEMGRQMKNLHSILQTMNEEGTINGYHTSNITKEGTLSLMVAFDDKKLKEIMSQSKIMICFPKCDTNPDIAGNIETLTQRYWEAMLSGCIILGRAPQELIDFIGYNPVVDVDWNDPNTQIKHILSNVKEYQDLVDRNYQTAKEKASWRFRIPTIKKILTGNGYTI